MVVCSNCGEENPERFSFCGVCGAPLKTAPPTTAEERKVVSVLFVDLVGFTAASDQADPEDVRARLRPYHAMLKREIERYGGTVEKFIGDAVMAVFGAPFAREDDAERAVRAALRITEAIPELNDEHPGLDLAVRGAVNTGEAVVSLSARPEHGEGIVTGDVVNTASRLQGVAPVGGVAVGEITYRTTKDTIEYAPLDPVSVKGKQEPIPIWHAVRARGRFTTEIERATTPFVGRQADLAMLQQTFTRTLRESSVQLVTVVGEPGVGKSRLTSEFFTWVDDQPDLVSWRHGRCLPYGEGITFWALGEIVKAQAGISESDPPGEVARKIAESVDAAVEDASERKWVASRLGPLVGSGITAAVTDRNEMFTAWRAFLEGVASRGPLVMVIEDLHWADDALLEFVEHLVEWATGVPLLVLCTARPELFERHAGWGGGKSNSTTIGLSPLSGEETAQLISALLSETVLPAGTQHALLERSGGNPLYAEEFVRMLLDRGILQRRGHAIELVGETEIPVPDTVQALIAARLDTLTPDRKALLQDAAVVGKVFWADALAQMSGRANDEVRNALHEVTRKELVRPARRPSIEGQAEYNFWHILVRDIAYSQIPRAARTAKHRAAAEWIEGIAGERVGDHAEILAFHYAEALSLARAAGSAKDETELVERALDFLVMSGARAFNLDLEKAGELFGRALDLLPADHPRKGSILVHLARTESERGRYEEAERLFEAAIEALRSIGDRVGTGDALARMARAAWRRGEGIRGRALAAEALKTLEQEPPGPELANALNEVGALAMLGGEAEKGIEYSERALRVSQALGLEAPVVRALETRGVARVELGQVEEGLSDLHEALKMGLDLGLGYETLVAYANLASMIERVEGSRAAIALTRDSVDFAERRGLAFMGMWMKSNLVSALCDVGGWDEALAVSEEVIDWDREQGGSQVGPVTAIYRAQVLVHRGRVNEAAALAGEFLPRIREAGDPQVVVPALYIAALIDMEQGQEAAALALTRETRSITSSLRPYRFLVLSGIVRVMIRCGAIEDAEDAIAGLEPRLARERADFISARAQLEEAHSAFDDASILFRELAEMSSELGEVIEHAHALLGEGRCLVKLGRKVEAENTLRAARDSIAALGAELLKAEVDELLARATALSS